MTSLIQSWISLYELSPSLKLYDDMLDSGNDAEIDEISGIVSNKSPSLNPIEVVLESLINVISENVSIDTLTSSEDKVLLNQEIRKKAAETILLFLKEDREQKLILMHKSWIEALVKFLRSLAESKGNLKMDEVLFRVSNRFRITASSAVRAVSSAISVHSKQSVAIIPKSNGT